MTHICRLCLKSVNSTNNDYISVHQSDNNGVAIATLVKTLVPELYLGLSVNPLICPPCYDALRDAYSFRLQCLRSDKLIGIFMRETHCASVTIVLQDVVDYWRNVYKTEPCRTEVARNNLSEWFGLEQKDEKRHRRPRLKRIVENQNSLNNSDVITRIISSRGLLEELDERIINDRLTKENAPLGPTSSEPEKSTTDAQAVHEEPTTEKPAECGGEGGTSNFADTFKLIPKDPCSCPSRDDCPTSETFRKGAPPFVRRMQQDMHEGCVVVCEHRHVPKCKYYEFLKWLNKFPAQLVQNAERHGRPGAEPAPRSPSSSCPTRFKTYTNRTKPVPENPDDDLQVAVAPQVDFVSVQDSDDEVDGEILIRELQKSENLKKLGSFAEGDANLEANYVLKKFVDKTDNSLSYALLPKTVWEGAFSDTQRRKDDSGGKTNCSDTVTNNEREVQKIIEKETRQNVDPLDQEVIEGATAVSPRGGFENMLEVNRKIVDKLANINSRRTTNKDSAFARPNPSEEKDDDSLGIINFKEAPSSSRQSQGERMPVIRVRPVSSLQKVRTLNHELFPRPTETNMGKSSRASTFPPPEVLPTMYQIMPAQKPTSLSPPVVLNSKIVSGVNHTLLGSISLQKPLAQSSDTDSSVLQISELNPTNKPTTSPTRLVPVTLDHVKRMGINPLRLKMLKLIRPVRKILPNPPAPPVVTVDVEGRNTELLLGECVGSEDFVEEEPLDIKDEPLDYVETDLFDDRSRQFTDSDGETTRSASETSLMDRLISDNLSHLIGDLSDVADDEFDEPEYVHINNVSFADLTKMVKESQQGTEEDISKSNPVVTEMNQAKRGPKSRQVDKTQGVKVPGYDSHLVRSRRPAKKRAKHLRIVPVDMDEDGPIKKRRRKRGWDHDTPSDHNKDVSVLFTNFSIDGDYINDHDYLVSPYKRNNMSFVKRKVESCLCLLCDVVHPANVHGEHMRCHSTRCAICLVDFLNVFMLNLHVCQHTSHCTECDVNVTYARYRHHAATHNMSEVLSNIYLPRENPSNKNIIMASRPADASKTSRRSGVRRSRRVTRSINYEDTELDTEEATVYDKTTKSFSTPSLTKCSTLEKKETENTEECSNPTGDLQFVNLTSLSKDENLSGNINVTVDTSTSASNSPSKLRKARKRKNDVKTEPESSKEAPAEMINETEEKEKRRTKSSSDSNDLADSTVTSETTARAKSPNSIPDSSSNAPEHPTSAATETTTAIDPLAPKQIDETAIKELKGAQNVERLSETGPETRQKSLRLRAPIKCVKRKGRQERSDTKATATGLIEESGGRKRKREETRVEDSTAALPSPKETDHSFSHTEADPVSKKEDRSVEEKNGADKTLVPKPTLSETRSSRSRGSLNLVEGLKIDAPARSRKPRKLPLPVPLFTEPESIPLPSPSVTTEQPRETTSEVEVCDNFPSKSSGSELQ